MNALRVSRAIAILLLAWQAVVVQAHLHVPSATAGAASARAAVASAPTQRQDGPGECPVCREVAHAGHYIAPGDVAVLAPVSLAAWQAVAVLRDAALAQSSHAWRSRAPPASPVPA